MKTSLNAPSFNRINCQESKSIDKEYKCIIKDISCNYKEIRCNKK